MRMHLLVLVLLPALALADLPLYKVIHFENAACQGNSNLNGTCYSSQECSARGGRPSGACAGNYGVCCVFSVHECGKTIRENNTYVMNPATLDPGQCSTRICPVHKSICKLRLDFNYFSIGGPSTDPIEAFYTHKDYGVRLSTMGQCLNDMFSVTSPGRSGPSPICGVATGMHMYVDVSKSCNDLTFYIGTDSVQRLWNIRVIQIACHDYANLPPQGCAQWFTADTGEVQSFNFGLHLANQEQKVCVRRNAGFCRVCFTAEQPTDFHVSGMAAISAGDEYCCSEGQHGDCLIVPGARHEKDSHVLATSRVCGRDIFGQSAGGTICTRNAPFSFTFYSNAGELPYGDTEFQVGFRLQYEQKPCVQGRG